MTSENSRGRGDSGATTPGDAAVYYAGDRDGGWVAQPGSGCVNNCAADQISAARPTSALSDAGVHFGQSAGQQLVDVWHAVRDVQGNLDAGSLRPGGEPFHAVSQCLVAAAGQQQGWQAGRVGLHRIGQRMRWGLPTQEHRREGVHQGRRTSGQMAGVHAGQLTAMLAELDRRHRRPKPRLKALVRGLGERRELVARHGCRYGTLGSELAKQSDGADPLAAQLMRIPLDWAEQQFRALGRRDARDLAVELVATYQGSALLADTLGQPDVMARQTRRLERWIDTLATPAESPTRTGRRADPPWTSWPPSLN